LQVNLNRFFEYRTETMRVVLPSHHIIAGGKRIFELPNTDEAVWSYSVAAATDLRRRQIYSKVSTTLSVITDLIPFSTIIVLNGLIYRTVRHKTSLLPRNAKRERRGLYIATILILIVLVYAICHSLGCLLNLVELGAVLTDQKESFGPELMISVSVSHLLITINASSNFAIYCAKDKKFRKCFLRLLFCGFYPCEGTNVRRASTEVVLCERGTRSTSGRFCRNLLRIETTAV